MYEDIQKNKFKTGIIIAIFMAMIGVIIYAICYFFEYEEFAVIIAACVAILSTIATYYNCEKVVLNSAEIPEKHVKLIDNQKINDVEVII